MGGGSLDWNNCNSSAPELDGVDVTAESLRTYRGNECRITFVSSNQIHDARPIASKQNVEPGYQDARNNSVRSAANNDASLGVGSPGTCPLINAVRVTDQDGRHL